MDAPFDLGLGDAPVAPSMPEPLQRQPSRTAQMISLALLGLAGGMGGGAGTGIVQGLARSSQNRRQQEQYDDAQNMRRFQYEQQQYQQQARDYERQQELRQKAVADAFAQLGKDAPNFTTRAEFEQRANLYSQQLQMMGIRVQPQALMQQVPYLEPSERDVIAEAINKNQKQFPDAWDGGAPLAAHIQYRDPKSGETRDIQIGKALEAGLVSLPVDTATGKWIGSEAKKPQDAPKIGTFEDYVTRAYGQNPTPSQIRSARREWAQSDNAPAAGPKTPLWVKDASGRVYDANGVAPAGTTPYEKGSDSPAPAKLSAAQQDDMVQMMTVEKMAGDVEALGDSINWSGVGGMRRGSMSAFAASATGRGKPEEISLRSKIGNIQATIAKLRGGTSFTPNEQALLESYTPTIDDSAQVIRQKLRDLRQFIADKRAATIKVAGGDFTPMTSHGTTPNANSVTVGGKTFSVQVIP